MIFLMHKILCLLPIFHTVLSIYNALPSLKIFNPQSLQFGSHCISNFHHCIAKFLIAKIFMIFYDILFQAAWAGHCCARSWGKNTRIMSISRKEGLTYVIALGSVNTRITSVSRYFSVKKVEGYIGKNTRNTSISSRAKSGYYDTYKL